MGRRRSRSPQVEPADGAGESQTMEPVRPPWLALKEWIPVENPEHEPDWFDQSNPWRPREIPHGDRILVLDAD